MLRRWQIGGAILLGALSGVTLVFFGIIPDERLYLSTQLPGQIRGTLQKDESAAQYVDIAVDPYFLEGTVRVSYDKRTQWTEFSMESSSGVVQRIKTTPLSQKPLMPENARITALNVEEKGNGLYAPHILIVKPLKP